MSEEINMYTFIKQRNMCHDLHNKLTDMASAYSTLGNDKLSTQFCPMADDADHMELFMVYLLNQIKMQRLKIGKDVVPIGEKTRI